MDKGYGEIVKLLIDNFADCNIQNDDGQTALHLVWDSVDIAAMLLQSHADINVQDRNGSTALHLAAENGIRFQMEVKLLITLCTING